MNPNQISRLFHNGPGRFITDRKNPLKDYDIVTCNYFGGFCGCGMDVEDENIEMCVNL